MLNILIHYSSLKILGNMLIVVNFRIIGTSLSQTNHQIKIINNHYY